MEQSRKMIVIPADQMPKADSQPTINIPKPSNIRNKAFDRLARVLKVVLKLASVQGYDTIGRIKSPSGDFVENSDIIPLLNHAMSVGRVMIGEQEFIKLLEKAQVDPDLIINDNVRSKLAKTYTKTSQQAEKSNDEASVEPDMQPEVRPQRMVTRTETVPKQTYPQPRKRLLSEEIEPQEEEDQYSTRKRRFSEIIEPPEDQPTDVSNNKRVKWIVPS